MTYVSFEEWMQILRRCAEQYDVSLKGSDMAHYDYYDRGDTPYGAVMDIREFGYDG